MRLVKVLVSRLANIDTGSGGHSKEGASDRAELRRDDVVGTVLQRGEESAGSTAECQRVADGFAVCMVIMLAGTFSQLAQFAHFGWREGRHKAGDTTADLRPLP